MDNIDLSNLPLEAYELIPTQMPPEGAIPNFANLESQAHIAAISIYVTLPLMLIFLVMRLYVWLYMGRSFGPDDRQ
ncbi:hypothetical protein MMYC01_204703 [Madurella mycetomatis]|uniref:Uncharacterized protein n=1 Tax=Madurella mycetomatis TaxID=100816 RepID=A0A175W746_9PEZI|nr:hypothetical protein MMYC01_204703 [Madurella mycetomatis]